MKIRNSIGVPGARCVLAVLLCALWSVSCSVDNVPAGGLVVALETDMAVPKDLDRVLIEASQGGNVFFSQERLIGEGRDLMPVQVRISSPSNSNPVLVRAIGFLGADARVERSLITPMPSGWLASVRLPLNFLCIGKVSPTGESACGPEQTCKQGDCGPSLLPSDLLVRYEPAVRSNMLASTVAADGGMDAAVPSASDAERCFDVASCFYQALDVEVEPTTCSFALPPEILPDQLNIALRLPLGQPGVCEAGSCFVVLDEDTEGYQIDAGRVYVPLSVCDRMLTTAGGAITLGLECPKKTLDNPICGPWSSVKTPVPTLDMGTDGMNPGIVVGSQPTRPSLLQGACSGTARQACGMCGTQARDCRDGTWSMWDSCVNGGTCTPGMTEACPGGGKRNCGGDCAWGECMTQTCMGPSSRACGNCGTQTRTCANGIWSEWTACADQGACVPNATQACAAGGTQVCGGSCQWGACGTSACAGPASESCGNCGTRMRVCDPVSGKYGEWGPCAGEGMCMPDVTRACGVAGMQTCRGDCQWGGACANQMCDGESVRPCGNCGTQSRSCNTETGTWSDWGECTDQGECAPNAARTCGNGGLQVCGGNCRWDPTCVGQRCTGVAAQSCGNCGIQLRLCNTFTGQYPDWSTVPCVSTGECVANSSRDCGTGGKQFCGADCRWQSGCGDQMCPGRAPRQDCGNCGTQAAVCDAASGKWSTTQYGECTNQGCKPGEQRSCGTQGGVQVCSSACAWTTCMCDPTKKPVVACGNCGTFAVSCNANGEWVVGTECQGSGECAKGTTGMCGTTNSGMRTCSNQCKWGACSGETMMCDPAKKPATTCGFCGTQSVDCDTATGNWKVGNCQNPGECEKNSTGDCGMGGKRSCSAMCKWGACTGETMMCDPAKKPPATCGFCGTQDAKCDTATGIWTVGQCQNPGECEKNTTGDCGMGGKRSCSATCTWGACMGETMMCEPAKKPATSCGFCGTQSVTCNSATGVWEVGSCQNPGECEKNSTGECGMGGRRTCSATCKWGDCMGEKKMCPPGTKPPTTCGFCGTQSVTCDDSTGTWIVGQCQNPGECEKNATGECGMGGMRTCSAMCKWGDCMGEKKMCPPGTKPPTTCGYCGSQSVTCDEGTGSWKVGACQNAGICEPGMSKSCTDGSSVTCSSSCTWPTCPIVVEPNPPMTPNPPNPPTPSDPG